MQNPQETRSHLLSELTYTYECVLQLTYRVFVFSNTSPQLDLVSHSHELNIPADLRVRLSHTDSLNAVSLRE